MHSFRNRILILIIGLMVGTQIVTLVAVSARIAEDVRGQANEQLQTSGSVVSQLLVARSAQLANAVSLLAADFGFREAVTSSDRPTLVSAMDNQARRVHAHLALVLDPEGTTIASTGISGHIGEPALERMMQLRASSRDRPAFVALNDKLYQFVVVPVRAPQLVAWVVMGFAVDEAVARELKRVVGLDVAFVIATDGGQRVVSSTLRAFGSSERVGDTSRDELAGASTLLIAGEKWFSISRALDPQDSMLQFVLLTPASVVLKPFDEAREAMLAIGGTALIFALALGVFLARSATQPVVELDVAARRIEDGDYRHAVSLRGAREFQRLAQTFNSMQHGIADRERQLRHLAYHDPATGLPNQRMAELEIDELAQDCAARFAVMVLDLQALEDVRATLGDAFFDRSLICVADTLRALLRDGTFLARLGPYSFLVLLRADAAAQAGKIAARICESLRQGLEVDQVKIVLDGAAGIALAPDHGASSADLLRRALIALRSARQQGLTVAHFVPGADEQFRRRLELSAALPGAIAGGQLTLRFQRKMKIRTRRVVGAEALVRWEHPQLGAISPVEFVPLAERTGAIRELTKLILGLGVQQLADWRARDLKLDLSVNISAADIIDPDLAPALLVALRRAGVPPSSLILEITETAVMHDRPTAAKHMELLRVAGIRFSIDDFGTGHSSLSLLQALPVDELKIDRQFVGDIETNLDSAKIVKSTIDLARALDLKVVAEGIESESVWNLLGDFGCHLAQGYYVSKPLAAADFLAFVALTNPPDATADDTQLLDLSLLRNTR